MQIIGPDIEPQLDWIALTDALAQGHELPRAEVADSFLYRGDDTLLTRSAWIDGLGLAIKPAAIFPGNPRRGLAMINGVVNLLDDVTGELRALVDFHLVTKWKTAGDSLLSARRLARPDARQIWVNFAHPDNGKVQVIDSETHEIVATLEPGPAVLHMEFTARGDQLWLSVRDGEEVQVWDPYTLKLLKRLPAHSPSGIFFSSRAHETGL